MTDSIAVTSNQIQNALLNYEETAYMKLQGKRFLEKTGTREVVSSPLAWKTTRIHEEDPKETQKSHTETNYDEKQFCHKNIPTLVKECQIMKVTKFPNDAKQQP